MQPFPRRARQAGAQVIDYALLIAVVSIGLAIGLRGLDSSICELPGRVAQLMGGQAAACAGGSGAAGAGGGGVVAASVEAVVEGGEVL